MCQVPATRIRRLVMPICMAACVLAAACTALRADERPNFVILLCDDLGYGDLGCYGHPAIRTPHLDRLAGQGMRLTACYSAAPVCSPSRVGLLTGRTPSRVGIYDWIPAGHVMHLPRTEITIGTLLRRAGYATCHVGKWHCNGKFNSGEQPQIHDHGFQYWFSTQNNAAPSHRDPHNFVRNGKAVGRLSGYSCQLVASEAITWLRQRPADRPFFLFVCFHEPHEPIDSPPKLVAQYPQATRRGEALYYANVTNMDAAVGQLMRALDDMQLADNTFVLFTSDNGPETLNRYRNAWRSHGSAGPLRGMKLHLYEGGIRVPGIIRFPGRIDPGEVIDEPVCGLDVLPTCCELAGMDTPGDRVLDGQSIVPLWAEGDLQRQTPLFWHYYRSIGKPKAAMRVGNWMILGHWDQGPLGAGGSLHPGDMPRIKNARLTGFELYDLASDVGQQTNLADRRREQLKKLQPPLVRKHREIQQEGFYWDVP